MFNPEYKIPERFKNGRKILESVEKLFSDITNAVEQIARDGHEEYVFKKYLQDKWLELLKLWVKYTPDGSSNIQRAGKTIAR